MWEGGVGLFHRGNALQREPDRQAALRGLPQPFDTALGLRASRGNQIAAQGIGDMAEPRFVQGFPRQLLLNRPVFRFLGIAKIYPDSVGIEGFRRSIAL
jgi:hypothetical protein